MTRTLLLFIGRISGGPKFPPSIPFTGGTSDDASIIGAARNGIVTQNKGKRLFQPHHSVARRMRLTDSRELVGLEHCKPFRCTNTSRAWSSRIHVLLGTNISW